MSLVVLGHQGGEATLPLMFASLSVAYGYRSGWLAGALARLVIGLPFAYWAYSLPRTPAHHDARDDAPQPEVRSWTRREVLAGPIFYVLLAGVLAPPFIGTNKRLRLIISVISGRHH